MSGDGKTGWESGTYKGSLEAQLDDALAATPDQRLEMLQAMIEFAAEAAVARRRAEELSKLTSDRALASAKAS